MLYRLIRPFAKFATRQFFSTLQIYGAAPLEKGPVIIVSNHPNVMLDGLVLIGIYKRSLWFLAKSTIFRGPILSWLLKMAHFIPVYRPQDHGRKMIQNRQVFKRVSEHLQGGGAIIIFPEGKSSESLRKILPVKTGAARMAFHAAEECGFESGVKIQPIGITYTDFQRFRSAVTAVVGEPIRVSDYREEYEQNPKVAIRKLSSDIEEKLRHYTAEIADPGQVDLVEKIGKLYRSVGYDEHDKKRLELVARNVEKLSPVMPEKAAEMDKRISIYLRFAASLNLDGSESLDVKYNPIFLFAISPFVLFGIITHSIPYRLIGRYVRNVLLKIERASGATIPRSQVASWQLTIAFFLFPVWYLLLSALVGVLSANTMLAVYSFFLLMFSGYCANRYFHYLCLFGINLFWPGRRSPLEVLKHMRDELVSELEELRVE